MSTAIKVLIWLGVAVLGLVLLCLLAMTGMMGSMMSERMSSMMGGGMMGAGLFWMIALAAILIGLIVLLVRSATHS